MFIMIEEERGDGWREEMGGVRRLPYMSRQF